MYRYESTDDCSWGLVGLVSAVSIVHCRSIFYHHKFDLGQNSARGSNSLNSVEEFCRLCLCLTTLSRPACGLQPSPGAEKCVACVPFFSVSPCRLLPFSYWLWSCSYRRPIVLMLHDLHDMLQNSDQQQRLLKRVAVMANSSRRRIP